MKLMMCVVFCAISLTCVTASTQSQTTCPNFSGDFSHHQLFVSAQAHIDQTVCNYVKLHVTASVFGKKYDETVEAYMDGIAHEMTTQDSHEKLVVTGHFEGDSAHIILDTTTTSNDGSQEEKKESVDATMLDADNFQASFSDLDDDGETSNTKSLKFSRTSAP